MKCWQWETRIAGLLVASQAVEMEPSWEQRRHSFRSMERIVIEISQLRETNLAAKGI